MKFHKYSCTGNDFILIDDREGKFNLSNEKIVELCSRRTGVGADGIILLQNSDKSDFRMKIINADASVAEMCGNGLRGISHFAKNIVGLDLPNEFSVETFNSTYKASVNEDDVKVLMTEAYDENKYDLGFIDINKKFFINTGVPHVVLFVSDVDNVQVNSMGSQIRYNKIFESGTNVNFVEVTGDKQLKVRTYERGVEDETLACGTGNLACALASKFFFDWSDDIAVTTKGGTVKITLTENGNWYQGPAKVIYQGSFEE